jgi:hypothetical protein
MFWLVGAAVLLSVPVLARTFGYITAVAVTQAEATMIDPRISFSTVTVRTPATLALVVG